MTEKRVKAWAVVDAAERMDDELTGYYRIYSSEVLANALKIPWEGERVVPVTIIVEES